MGLFKKKIVKEIPGGAWGHLISAHKMDGGILSDDIRCVEREGFLEGKGKVRFLRVFKLSEIKKEGITVDGWATFDQYPQLILFEGYLQENTNEATLERRRT
jgi:hypothetical protein